MSRLQIKQGVGVFLPFLLLLLSGWMGLDFGYHWDEKKYQIGEVKYMLETETFLPRTYMYPATSYWLELGVLVPYAIKAAKLRTPFGKSLPWLKNYLIQIVGSESYLLDIRFLFLVLTSLTIIWTYLSLRSWRGSHTEALLGAWILGSSWEVAYHARWVATDGLVLSFGAMALFFLSRYLTTQKRWWLFLCAAACGIAMATKYTAALLFVMVIFAVATEKWGIKEKILTLLRTGALTFGTYLFLTPGTLLQPSHFWYWTNFIRMHYLNGGHGGYDIPSGMVHLGRILQYFGVVFFSYFPWISLFLCFFLLSGVVSCFRKKDRLGLICIGLSVVFFLYFSRQKVMIVRNLLVVAPFLTLLLVRGVFDWESRLAKFRLRYLPLGLLAVSLLINQLWLFRTAESIFNRSPERTLNEAGNFIQKEGTDKIYVSPLLQQALKTSLGINVANKLSDWQQADHILFYASEGDVEFWPANIPDQVERWFGPHEINFSVYPSWTGDNRIVLMTRPHFEHALAAWKKSPWLSAVPTGLAYRLISNRTTSSN